MQDIECELAIGDAIQIDEVVYTVIDIEDGEVSFRVDFVEELQTVPPAALPAR